MILSSHISRKGVSMILSSAISRKSVSMILSSPISRKGVSMILPFFTRDVASSKVSFYNASFEITHERLFIEFPNLDPIINRIF